MPGKKRKSENSVDQAIISKFFKPKTVNKRQKKVVSFPLYFFEILHLPKILQLVKNLYICIHMERLKNIYDVILQLFFSFFFFVHSQ